MAAANQTRRLMTEIRRLEELGNSTNPSQVIFLLNSSLDEISQSKIILGRILPQLPVFNRAAFQIEIKLPDEYPFRPPEIRFITPIYHPNVEEATGKVCAESLRSIANYRPTTSLAEIVTDLVYLIDHPDLEHALRPDVAAEYANNRPEFDRKAIEMINRHGLSR